MKSQTWVLIWKSPPPLALGIPQSTWSQIPIQNTTSNILNIKMGLELEKFKYDCIPKRQRSFFKN